MDFHGLRIIEGELMGAEIPIMPDESIIVGRDANECNLVLRDGTVSRKHLLIDCDESGQYYVTDYSKTGTIVDGGDRVHIGSRTPITSGTVLIIGMAGTKIILT